MKNNKKTFGMVKKVLAAVLAITIVFASAPVSALAAKAPILSGVPKLTYIKYKQSDKTKAKTATIKVKNINTKTQSVTWSTTNKNIVKITKKTANSATIGIYYKKGSATLKAVVKNKKTKKKVKTLSKTFTVYQGATGVDVANSKGISIKNKTVSIELKDTYTLSKKSLPSGKVNEPKQKTPAWSQTVDSKAVGVISGNAFKPVQANVIGRGVKYATVTATVKGSTTYKSNTTIAVNGGMFTVSNIDSKDATLEVGVNVNADITLLKGTTMTLTGIEGTETAGNTLSAKYVGSAENRAVFKIDQKEKIEKGGYDGVYQISFVDGAKYVNNNNKVSYYADMSNEIELSSNANVKKVTVSGSAVVPVSVEQENTTSWIIVLPYGSAYSSLLEKNIKVELESQHATMGAITTANGGQSYTFTVTAQDRTTVNYVINVSIKAKALSSDSSIKGISVSNSAIGVIPAAQDVGTTKWRVTLPFGTSLSSISATDFVVELNDKTATMASIVMNDGGATYNFTVKAEDGSTVDYEVDVDIAPSSDATVKAISVSNNAVGVIQAVKEAGTRIWCVTLPFGTSLSSISATDFVVELNDKTATIASIVTNDGGATYNFTVKAEDGSTVDYEINVNIAPSSDATVKTISVSNNAVGVIQAVKEAGTRIWRVTLPFGTSLSSISATDFVVELNDKTAIIASIVTNDGGATYNFKVSAEDGSTVDYEVDVDITPSSDATVKAISVSNSAVGVIQVVQDAETGIWRVTLPFGTSISATDFSVELNDNAATYGALIDINSGQYNFTVTAEDGTAVTYSIYVTIAPSNDASVKDVSVYNVQYGKYFYAAQESETGWLVELPYGIKLMVNYYVNVTTSDNRARVKEVVISEDGETCTFSVEAEDGTTVDYTIKVTNAPKSNNANIARFVVYDADYNQYDAIQESETTWVLELPIGIDLVSMKYCGLAIVGEDAQINVNVTYLGTEDAWYTMKVTSHDGTTIKEYTLIIREANSIKE